MFTLKFPASVYMLHSGVHVAAVRVKNTLCTVPFRCVSTCIQWIVLSVFLQICTHVVHDCVRQKFTNPWCGKTSRKGACISASCYEQQLPGCRVITTSAVVAKMAHSLAELEVPLDGDQAGDQGKGVMRRCRGRPRLTDSDRAQRRLESRKKYDVRRVYLGESHKLWSELRRRTSLSDAGLAEYLILLNSTYGEKYQQKYCG